MIEIRYQSFLNDSLNDVGDNARAWQYLNVFRSSIQNKTQENIDA